jgi:hypothetical protein
MKAKGGPQCTLESGRHGGRSYFTKIVNIEYPPASPERLAMAGRSNKEPQNFEVSPSTFDIPDFRSRL